jgi:hypothetical protein
VDFSSDQDTVNFSPTEKMQCNEGDLDECGWFHHHHMGYIGNEGEAEESIYSRYVLAFCRRGAADACPPGDGATVEQRKDSQEKRAMADEEERTKQRNADGDARGIARFGDSERP